jgi:hypothetical protein
MAQPDAALRCRAPLTPVHRSEQHDSEVDLFGPAYGGASTGAVVSVAEKMKYRFHIFSGLGALAVLLKTGARSALEIQGARLVHVR